MVRASATDSTRQEATRDIFEGLSHEHGFQPLRIEGRVPAALEGVLYRNGPARFGNDDGRYGHWFDGDGGISAVRLGAGRAEGSVRLVKSWHLDRERDSGRTTTLGFGTRSPRALGQLWAVLSQRRRNPANTSVMWWGDRLLALYEGDRPTVIDPDTLETIGVSDLDGVVTSPFSAHPSAAPDGTIYNFGISYGAKATLSLYRLAQRAALVRRITLPIHSLVHDFVVTKRYAIFFVPPVRMATWPVLFGRKSPVEAMKWCPDEGTRIYIVPLDPDAPIQTFAAEPFYQWHFANAYEDGDTVVVDSVQYPDFGTNDFLSSLYERRTPARAARGRLVRRTIDLTTAESTLATLFDRSCEFPRVAPGVDGARHRYVYTAAHSTPAAAYAGFDEVVRVDTETGDAEPYAIGSADFVSEPVFADGYLLLHVYDGARGRTNLTILDASSPARAPLARCWFDQALPPSFHGLWKSSSRLSIVGADQ